MNRLLKVSLVLALMALIAAPAAGQDQKKKKKNRRGQAAVTNMMKKLAKAELTDEQKTKITKLVKDCQPKMAEARKAYGLTDAQKLAQVEAVKKAEADGVKGKKRQEAVTAALKLSDEQKKAQQELRKMQSDLNKAILAVLTEEQRKAVNLGGRTRGNKKKKKNDK